MPGTSLRPRCVPGAGRGMRAMRAGTRVRWLLVALTAAAVLVLLTQLGAADCSGPTSCAAALGASPALNRWPS